MLFFFSYLLPKFSKTIHVAKFLTAYPCIQLSVLLVAFFGLFLTPILKACLTVVKRRGSRFYSWGDWGVPPVGENLVNPHHHALIPILRPEPAPPPPDICPKKIFTSLVQFCIDFDYF